MGLVDGEKLREFAGYVLNKIGSSSPASITVQERKNIDYQPSDLVAEITRIETATIEDDLCAYNIINIGGPNNEEASQLAMDLVNNRIFYRARAGNWQTWAKILTDENFEETISVKYAADAGTVSGYKIVKLTQSAYDALTTKDANTIYLTY